MEVAIVVYDPTMEKELKLLSDTIMDKCIVMLVRKSKWSAQNTPKIDRLYYFFPYFSYNLIVYINYF